MRRPFGQKYAFVVVAVIFTALLASAALRSAPGVLMLPLEKAFGWDRATISLGAGIGILLYGLTGPFAAALMQSFGLRRTVMLALALMSLATAASLMMREAWQYIATWGVVAGLGTGSVASVLAATIANRWFVQRRGLVMGLLTASTATGNLIFLPVMAVLAESGGFKPVAIAMAVATAALIPLIWLFVPESPAAIGQSPYGADGNYRPPAPAPLSLAFSALGRAARTRTFWLLFGGFFVCGFTTNGLVATHLIAFCGDHGLPEVKAAGLMAVIGAFDLIGTTASGWLTDRFDSRKLLFVYYALRGVSLMVLPFTDFSMISLGVFAVFYGLDWVATVPPTMRLATEAFGDRDGPIVFGWIAAGHQAGAASAAVMAGLVRSSQGDYLGAFVIAGMTGLAAALMSILIRRGAASPVTASA